MVCILFIICIQPPVQSRHNKNVENTSNNYLRFPCLWHCHPRIDLSENSSLAKLWCIRCQKMWHGSTEDKNAALTKFIFDSCFDDELIKFYWIASNGSAEMYSRFKALNCCNTQVPPKQCGWYSRESCFQWYTHGIAYSYRGQSIVFLREGMQDNKCECRNCASIQRILAGILHRSTRYGTTWENWIG